MIATRVSEIYQIALPQAVARLLDAFSFAISFGLDAIATPLTCVGLGIDVEPMSRAALIGTGWFFSLCGTVFAFMFMLQYERGKEPVGGRFSAQTGWYVGYRPGMPGMPGRPGMPGAPAWSCNCCPADDGYLIPEKEIGGRLGSLEPVAQPHVPEGTAPGDAFHSTFLAHLSNYRPIKGGHRPRQQPY